MKSLFVLTLLLSMQGFAFNKADFLRKVERNEVSFERGTIMNMQGEVLERMTSMAKAKHPGFKPSMMYYHSVIIEKNMYIIFYDYTSTECVMTYMDMSKSVEDNKKVLSAGPDGSIVNSQKELIPIKICEKLYNFYLKK